MLHRDQKTISLKQIQWERLHYFKIKKNIRGLSDAVKFLLDEYDKRENERNKSID